MTFYMGTEDKPVEFKCFLLSTYLAEKAFGHSVPTPPFPLYPQGPRPHMVSPASYLSCYLSSATLISSSLLGLYRYQYSTLHCPTLPMDSLQGRHECWL